ncbi:MAG: IPT/TIG domain-containing protein [Candidatus Brevundimonas phytovorans]|nr:IPT/TIG domain-containing protein [Brevundimonas sp.]WEK58165.1 MAG: IPT/TIG domain-containing protein [Brevundimonas sp.]
MASFGDGVVNITLTCHVDGPPTVSISDVTQEEGDDGVTNFRFTVSLSHPSQQLVGVNFSTADGSATVQSGDYESILGFLTFGSGETQKTVTVPVRGDTKLEADETFFVNLDTPINALMGDDQGVGTIRNDDKPVVTAITPNKGLAAGGTGVYILGSNFSGVTAVSFGGAPAVSFTVNGLSQITATAPAGSGTVDVVVTAQGVTSATSPADQFTYLTAPTVTSITPSSGLAAGGASVVITGTDFSDVTGVRFGDTPAMNFTVDSETQITAIAPASAGGPVDVRVSTTGGTSATSAADQFTYLAVPTVTAISPSSGPTAGGTSVIITGTNFSGATGVRFGEVSTTGFAIFSETMIVAMSPGGIGAVDVRVTTAGGTSATSAADPFTYVGAPTVTSVSPTAGPSTGGTSVIITGTSFSGATAVTFGATAATGFTVNSATQITATAPAGTGTVDIRVTTAGGTSAISAADQFTYLAAPTVTSITPTSGPSTGGTTVTITGTNFSGVTAVTFGGMAATGFTVNSTTQITATAPAGTGTVDIRVTTAGGTSATSAADPFTYVGAPMAANASLVAGYNATGVINLKGSIIGSYTDIAVATAPTHGSTTVSGDLVTYTPASGYVGSDSFTYTATGPGGTSAPATVSITVTPGAPTVGGTAAAVAYNTPTAIDLSASITGVYTSLVVATPPSHGATSVAGDVVTYTPATGYFGQDDFTVTATGPGGTSAPATVSLTVATPDAPTVAGTAAAVAYNTPTAIDLSASITGVYTSLAVATPPSHGATSVAGDVVTYTPATGYFGQDDFTVTATGPGGTSAPATVSLTVATPAAPIIDQPTQPVVVPPSNGASGATSVTLAAGSQGIIDGYRITAASLFGTAEVVEDASAVSAKSTGSVSPKAAPTYRLVYTPAANFMGEDTVTVVAYGPGGDSAPVTFTFQVAGKAPDLSGAVLAGASVTFNPTTGLVGGPFQALRVTSPPAFGAATVNGLSLVFTPGPDGGTTTFDYVVDLPFGSSAAGRVSLTSNALPVAEALVAQTLQGVPVTVRISDAEGGPFTGAAVVSMAPVSAGAATIAKVGQDYDLTFVSTGDFSGEAVVTYSLSNASGTTNSTLTVTVEARPDPSLDPEVRGVATSQVTAARRFADAQINNFQQRLRDLHDGTNGSSNGLRLNLGLDGAEADRDPQQALRRQLGRDRSLDPGALGGDRDREMLGLDLWAGRTETAAPAAAGDDRLNAASAQSAAGSGAGAEVGLWTSGSVDWGRQDATGQRDSRFTTQGATVGLDLKVSDQLIVGGGVGYGEDKTRIGDQGSLTQGKAFTGALYASWRPADVFYVDGLLGYADLDFTSRRWVEGLAGQADGYAEGDRSGEVRFVSAAFGRVLRGERVTSDFYARLDARDITLKGFTETSGGLSALDWDEIGQQSLSANLGASWRWTLDSRRYGRFVPAARVEWSHELEDIGVQGVRYADWATSPTYLVPLNAWSRNAINLNLGAEWSLSDRLMLSLGYRGALGDASTSHGAEIGMKYGW